ncbi:hypothetical protein [Xanthobacter agilis]|uniref:Transposase n=1 Tax=Xanthobacter agilis TaxID=47492 RepID=A0ABU0LF98_XANAG|nr:hypothetical protein [Xanthobacter agilis]MDQ0505820.1 hypothetical protein [Xanthobacter agilis]
MKRHARSDGLPQALKAVAATIVSAFSSEVDFGSREGNAPMQKLRADDVSQGQRKTL